MPTLSKHILSEYHSLLYLLTYSMVQSPSWEAKRFVASQEIPRISWHPKVHYHTHKRPPPVSILGQPNPVHIPTSHLLGIHPNIIHPSMPRSPACECFLTKFFYREGLLAPRPTPKLEDHPSSAVRDCLFNLFAATLLIGGRSSIRNLRTHHAVVTGTHCMDSFCIKLYGWNVISEERWRDFEVCENQVHTGRRLGKC